MNLREAFGLCTTEASGIDPGGHAGSGGDRVGLSSETGRSVVAMRVEVDESGRDVKAASVDYIAATIRREVAFDCGDPIARDADIGYSFHAASRVETVPPRINRSKR